MTTMESIHKTVLLNEAIEGLNLKNDSIVLDGTFGGGGHSREICESYKGVKIIAIDQDADALERGKESFKDLDCDITFHNSNFRDLEKVLESVGVKEVDGIILDLGLSSDQLENSGRGFSFMKDEALLMTMKENPRPEDLTATDVVNSWSEENLANIIFGYGEEKFSRKIAKGIVDARKKEEIKTTFDLVKIIEASVPNGYKKGRIHCATKTFQALRIAVNDELGALQAGLSKGFDVLKVGGRMSVISFHSLEDRVVKRYFKELEKDGKARLINKKPVIPGEDEIKNNRRSRSAKLRVIEKI
jgi:16S rRNA (cytosine1402-N4)-methyltransferase